MEVLRDYGYVDARSMGVRTKVLPLMKAGGKEPVFEVTEDYVKTMLAKIKVQGKPLKGQYTYLKGHDSLKSDGEIRETPLLGQTKGHHDPISDLLNVLRTAPSADYQTLSQVLGVSEATIKRYIQKLKKQNQIRRIGSRKTGHWEVQE